VGTHSRISPVVNFADFAFDLRTGELRRNGNSIKLQPQPAKVLAVLVTRPGEIVTRQHLTQEVWGPNTFVDFEQGLNFAIRQIRAALEDDAETPMFLETLPKRGYRFLAAVSGASQPEVQAPAQLPVPATPVRSNSRFWLALVTAAGLAVTLVLVFDWGRLRDGLGIAPKVSNIQSLAVLPLHNLSQDPEQEYFSDGMTDELITDLAKYGGLRVISHTSVERYKATKRSLPEIARELGVDAVVEGTVTRSGDRVRITAQLIDAHSDRHLWADSYERDLRDVLALQSEVSRDIAAQVHTTVSRSEGSRATVAHPVNPDAHEAYLRGLYFWNKRTEAGIRKGIDYFEQATRLDPNYANAYAGLAVSYIVAVGHRVLPPEQGYPKAREAALKALQFDDRIAEAHTALGSFFWEYKWDRFAAEKEYRRAIEVNPSYATAPQWFSEELAALGRRDEASTEIKRAQQLDPLSLPIGVVAGWILYLEGDYHHAIEQYKRTLEMDPNFALGHSYLGRVYAQTGDLTNAILECQIASRLTGDHPFSLVWLGYAYAKAGNRKGALHILRQLQSISRQKYVAPHDIAAIYAGLGERSKAVEWLSRAYGEHSYTALVLHIEPEFDVLHSDARFQDLVHRIGVQQ